MENFNDAKSYLILNTLNVCDKKYYLEKCLTTCLRIRNIAKNRFKTMSFKGPAIQFNEVEIVIVYLKNPNESSETQF